MPFEMAPDDGAWTGPSPDRVRPELWLLGQPPLCDYLDMVRRLVEGGEAMDRRALTDEWRVANDHYGELESREAGLADKGRRKALPKAMRPLADALLQNAHVRRTFDSLPVSVEMVELDRLVVYQPHVTLPFAEGLAARLDPGMAPEALFRFCHRLDGGDPPVRVRRLGEHRFLFISDSNDFRLHDPLLLDDEALRSLQSFGPVAAAVGLPVGYGANVLSVIRSDRRALLHNGYHRAYALRAAGITHAPAVVQTVTRRDELLLVCSRAVADDPAFFFAARRPPLLKDFFDPLIRKVLPVRRMEKVIEVSIEIREHDVPAP